MSLLASTNKDQGSSMPNVPSPRAMAYSRHIKVPLRTKPLYAPKPAPVRSFHHYGQRLQSPVFLLFFGSLGPLDEAARTATGCSRSSPFSPPKLLICRVSLTRQKQRNPRANCLRPHDDIQLHIVKIRYLQPYSVRNSWPHSTSVQPPVSKLLAFPSSHIRIDWVRFATVPPIH